MVVPQEIIDNIIAAVGNDTHLLKKCALVSSSFLRPSRKQLFSRISLESDQKCQRIHQVLVQNPVIQSFLRSITLSISVFEAGAWMKGSSLPAVLRLPFCFLERFSIIVHSYGYRPLTWNDFSIELKDALLNIIHSSTLKTLFLSGISKVPITSFLHTVHFTTLELHSPRLWLNDFGDENSESSSLTRAASNSMASHTEIDRCLWYLEQPFLYGTRYSLHLVISH
jgi:hypothetical protein